MENNLGERFEYTLDAQDNRTAERASDSISTLRHQQQCVFDELGRLLRNLGVNAQTTQYACDLKNSRTVLTTPRNHIHANSFVALNRLFGTTDPLSGVTAQAFDAQVNHTPVVDPRGDTTTYAYDGLAKRSSRTITGIVGGVPDPAVTTSYSTSNNRLNLIGAQTVHSDASGKLTLDRADRALSTVLEGDDGGCAPPCPTRARTHECSAGQPERRRGRLRQRIGRLFKGLARLARTVRSR